MVLTTVKNTLRAIMSHALFFRAKGVIRAWPTRLRRGTKRVPDQTPGRCS